MSVSFTVAVLTMFVAIMLQTEAGVLPNNALESKYVGIDSYMFEFQTPDGISRREKGFFSNGVWTVIGEVSWIADDGKLYSYSYIADDNGYKQVEVPITGIRPAPVFPTPKPPTPTRPITVSAPETPVIQPPVMPIISCGTQAALLGCGK